MVLIGLVLLLLGAAAGTVATLATYRQTGTIEASVFGWTREVTGVELLAVGGAAVLLVCLGWALLSGSLRRRARTRRDEGHQERVAELERDAETREDEHDRRMREAGLRDDEMRAREEALRARERELDAREREIEARSATTGAIPVVPAAEAGQHDARDAQNLHDETRHTDDAADRADGSTREMPRAEHGRTE